MDKIQECILWELERGYRSPEQALLKGSEWHMKKVREQHKKTSVEIKKRWKQ